MGSNNVNKSYWLMSVNLHKYPTLENNIDTDVLVIGGGMVGMTSAYLLSQEGYSTVLTEGNNLFNGVSGNTTAKITSQHGLIYDKLIKSMGIEKAKIYADSNEYAIQFISDMVSNNNIKCDFEKLPAYIFTDKASSIENIERETRAALKIGINASYLDNLALPLDVKAAVVYHNQAQFHPVKYLNELSKLFITNGGKIYENTRAKTIEQGAKHIIKTMNNYAISAKYVIIASHFPFYDGLGMYFTRLYGERSYITAVTIKENFPKGMFITAEDPTLSLRTQVTETEKLLLVGGENHKTGDNKPSKVHYNNLLERANQLYTVTSNPYRWSAQDYSTPDGIPYIGILSNSSENIFVATGFAKWGMTTGTLSAVLIKDLIVKGTNPWQDLYNPSRFNLKTQPAITFVKESINVAKELIKGKTEKVPDDIVILKGEAKVFEINGKKYGAYRDDIDELFVLDITCTHLGCELRWNDAELSWDCPCHASRFNYDGSVIEGPAVVPLKRDSNHIHPNLK